MNQDTPTTDTVRAGYVQGTTWNATPDVQAAWDDQSEEAFDRWLTEHDADVASKAKAEALSPVLANIERLESNGGDSWYVAKSLRRAIGEAGG